MAGLLLLRMGVTRAREQIQGPGPGPLPQRTENKMLRLHESLSESLYQNKNRSNEKLSVKIVFLLTLVAALTTGLLAQQHPPHIITGAAYLLLVWLLPMWSYVLGVRRRSPFLLLPWIFVSCVLGMVAEMFLLWAAVSSVGANPPVSLSGSPPCDLLLLLLLALPLPVLLSVPVRAFVYMDIASRRNNTSINYSHCMCCCSKHIVNDESALEEDAAVSAEEEEDGDKTGDTGLETGVGDTADTEVTSIMITRFQNPPSFLSLADRALETVREHMVNTGMVNSQDAGERGGGGDVAEGRGGDNAGGDGEGSTERFNANIAAIPTPPLDLFDLGSIHVEEIPEETQEEQGQGHNIRGHNLEPLPPSYSHAQGLDQLPSYEEALVTRVEG